MSHHVFRRALRQMIADHYNLEELRILVFDLNVDWDELRGDVKSNKITSLVERMERDERLSDLLALLGQDHPGVTWPSLPMLVRSSPPPNAQPIKGDSRPRVDLSGTVLRGMNFSGAKLSGAKLNDIDWRRAELYLADLSDADLTGADLRRAKMRKANLSHADLTNARLDGADLRLADLTGAKITLAQLRQIKKLNGAIFPDGKMYQE